MSKGFPFECFAGEINVNPDTVYEWCKVHPEFSEAKKIGRAKSLKYMMNLGRSGMLRVVRDEEGVQRQVKFFDSTVWVFMMKNMHKWSDRSKDDPDEVDGLDFITE